MIKNNTVIVRWPDSQVLTQYEGFLENISMICDLDGLEKYGPNAYLVNKDWYTDLQAGKLNTIDEDEYDRLKSETIKDTHHWIDIEYRDVDGCYYGD